MRLTRRILLYGEDAHEIPVYSFLLRTWNMQAYTKGALVFTAACATEAVTWMATLTPDAVVVMRGESSAQVIAEADRLGVNTIEVVGRNENFVSLAKQVVRHSKDTTELRSKVRLAVRKKRGPKPALRHLKTSGQHYAESRVAA